MKRIYYSILVTALISLFLLGQLIDQLFDAQYDNQPVNEFVIERHFVKGLSRQLSEVSSQQLDAKVGQLSQQFDLELSLESASEFALSTEVLQQLQTDGLVTDSESGVQILHAIKNHRQWLLNYKVMQGSQPELDDNSQLEVWMTILFYFGFCLVLLLWTLPLTRRLSNLNRLAHEFGTGDLSKRVSPSRLSYIAELETSFNRMAGQIEELLAENKLLAGSVSHDLRTPLSCLRFGIDAALETEQPDKKNYYLSRMEQDLTRMESMLEAFLDYASLERKRFELAKTNTDITNLLQSTVKACIPVAENKQVKVALELNECPIVDVDPNWIGRAVSNLITNSIHHGRQNILVSCHYRTRAIEICVEDDGQGIPEEEFENIFKAFVKLDKSRTKNNRYGLGLAIVSRVVNWHNGEINVGRSEKLDGASFSIVLPQ